MTEILPGYYRGGAAGYPEEAAQWKRTLTSESKRLRKLLGR